MTYKKIAIPLIAILAIGMPTAFAFTPSDDFKLLNCWGEATAEYADWNCKWRMVFPFPITALNGTMYARIVGLQKVQTNLILDF